MAWHSPVWHGAPQVSTHEALQLPSGTHALLDELPPLASLSVGSPLDPVSSELPSDSPLDSSEEDDVPPVAPVLPVPP
jgi:hypothetical protein